MILWVSLVVRDREVGAHVIPLLPLHAVADGGVHRPRGRPKKVEPAPARADLDFHAEVARQRLEHVEANELVRAVSERADGRLVLQRVAEALAREAAVLEHERLQVQVRGRDVGQLVSRRVEVLRKLADLQQEIESTGVAIIDPNSEGMQRLYKLFVDDVVGVAKELLPPELLDLFLNKLAQRFDDWEERAESILR